MKKVLSWTTKYQMCFGLSSGLLGHTLYCKFNVIFCSKKEKKTFYRCLAIFFSADIKSIENLEIFIIQKKIMQIEGGKYVISMKSA